MSLVQQLHAAGRQVADTVTLTPGRVLLALLGTLVAVVFYVLWFLAAVWLGGNLIWVNPLLGLVVFVVLASLPVVLVGRAFARKVTGGGDS